MIVMQVTTRCGLAWLGQARQGKARQGNPGRCMDSQEFIMKKMKQKTRIRLEGIRMAVSGFTAGKV